MPNIQFHKYQGTGNDFVMVDNRNLEFDQKNISLIAALCDRRFGIGGDGLILIEEDEASDFKMIYFNADGTQSLCGNGSRCAVTFAKYLGMIEDEAKFNAFDGYHEAFIQEGLVHLQMHDIEYVENSDDAYFVDTGSPHLIKIVEDLDQLDVKIEGSKIRYSDQYKKEGININFIESANGTTSIRTYERGVEDETLSCGTGCTAVALTLSHLGAQSPVTLSAKGGTLQVSFEKVKEGFKNIYLIGPAEQVYSGEIEI
jgi:diaminopimelate epimerase